MHANKFEMKSSTNLHLILKAPRTSKPNLILNIKEETEALPFFDFSIKGEFIYIQKHGLIISLFKQA